MKSRAIKHGEKITEPGVYDMPLNWYHDDCCDGPSISSTGLRTIDDKSPLHYWDKSPLNKDRDRSDDDDSEKAQAAHFRIGRAAHLLLLEPDVFKSIVVTRPPQFDSWRTNDAKKWRAGAQSSGQTVLDPREFEQVAGVAAALRKHPLHNDGVIDGEIEKSVFWKDGHTGVWLKIRPDVITASANVLVDIKTTTDARERAIYYAVRDLGYDMQLALQGIGLKVVLGRVIEDYACLFVEVKRPHAIGLAPMHDKRIHFARLRLRRAINTFATCYRAKDWPAYPTDGKPIMLSDEDEARLDREISSGLLPKKF